MSADSSGSPAAAHPVRGMDRLVVDWTKISYVDGEKGRLYYRGIDIAELTTQASFEETLYLLVCGVLPTESQLKALTWKIRHLAMPPDRVLRIIKELPRHASPLAALQVGLSALTCLDQGERLSPEESLFENALRVIAQTPVLVAAMHRHTQGLPLISPLPNLNHAENFHYMLTGQIPSRMTARFFEIALIVQMDHGFNPSTFTARAVASTLASLPTAMAAAVAALSGPLHGGAATSVLEMFDSLQGDHDHARIAARLQERLVAGLRIMGMGHRIYRTFDPRARILEDVLLQLTHRKEVRADYELLKTIEAAALDVLKTKERKLFTNVDFWTGTLYQHLGLARPLYPALFATARVVGWCAHILELRQANRLYRPLSEYRGEVGLAYTPMAERGHDIL